VNTVSNASDGPRQQAASAENATLDARALREHLTRVIEPAPTGQVLPPILGASPEVGPPVERRMASGGRAWSARLFKTLVALAVLVAVVWAPLQAYLEISSAEAVVNARLVVLKAPIEGLVSAPKIPLAGDVAEAGLDLLQIRNPRNDTSQGEALRQEIANLVAEQSALRQKLVAARGESTILLAQIEAFNTGRLQLLDIDLAILNQKIGVAQERPTPAELGLKRARIAIERQALAKGTYIGDSYNDRPQSAQRRDDLERQIVEIQADLDANLARQRDLRLTLARVERQDDSRTKANIVSPLKARIWDVLVSTGEQVNRGQDLVRLLSCETAVVTAAVNEAVYNRLSIGMSAQFVPRGAGEGLPGTVVNLTGMADASSNYAIDPAALTRQPYRVTVAVPSLARTEACTIGRTGHVVFGDRQIDSLFAQSLSRVRSYLP
jgi:multidrug resistance efflux pump